MLRMIVDERGRRPCPECKEPIMRDARICPHCRTPLAEHPEWKQMQASAGGCSAALVAFALPAAILFGYWLG